MKPNIYYEKIGTSDCYPLISCIIKFMNEATEYGIITQETKEGVKYPLQPMEKSCALEKVIVTDKQKQTCIIEKRDGSTIATLGDMGDVASVDFLYRPWNESDIRPISLGKNDRFKYSSKMSGKRIRLTKYTEKLHTHYNIVPKRFIR